LIEKMKFVSVIGRKEQLDTVTEKYLGRYEIQLENAVGVLKNLNNLTPGVEVNPYREPAAKAAEIAAHYGSDASGCGKSRRFSGMGAGEDTGVGQKDGRPAE